MPPGSTIEVDKAPEDDENDVNITIVKPKERTRETVGVGAKGGRSTRARTSPSLRRIDALPDLPDEPEVLPDVPDAPPAPPEEDPEPAVITPDGVASSSSSARACSSNRRRPVAAVMASASSRWATALSWSPRAAASRPSTRETGPRQPA